jgi:hypothetical protein
MAAAQVRAELQQRAHEQVLREQSNTLHNQPAPAETDYTSCLDIRARPAR